MDINSINVITLAYMGDAVFEVYMRKMCIRKGIVKVLELQKEVTRYVSAKGQASILNYFIENHILTDEEIGLVKRGRNYKRNLHPKHTSLGVYKLSTGFETLIGYLYLSNHIDRLEEIMKEIEVKSCMFLGKML